MGQNGIDRLNEGVNQLRAAIKKGDIQGVASILKNVGANGLRKLTKTTDNNCLKKLFPYLAKKDEKTANQIIGLCDANKVAEIVCNLLDYKAQQFRKCLKCQWK